MDKPQDLHLSVHPSVVFKLGQDLITDDVQALVELIKNSYDAESPSVEVIIDTDIWTDLRSGAEIANPTESPPPENVEPARGRIIIRDRGRGMRFETIRDGWLTVSSSEKRKQKDNPELLRGRRTPLGDKGLGRLGAQRLGRALALTTTPALEPGESPESSPGYETTICWDDFSSAESLANVPIRVTPIERTTPEQGTTLEIRGLNSPLDWSPSGRNLERRLSRMMSPYEEIPGFKVRIVSDGQQIDLREQTQAVRDKAAVAYRLRYDSGRIEITADVSTLYLQPLTGQDDIAMFDSLIGGDNGYAFLAWYLSTEQNRARDLGIQHGDVERFVHAAHSIDISAAPEYERVKSDLDGVRPLIDPGPFSGEIEQVVLRVNPTSVFDTLSDYRDFVGAISGIRVYRDGFGIPLDDDWLNLAAQWSSASSFYTIRPENVIGHIDLSAERNGALIETTNREAFSDTPAFRNFLHIVAEWLTFSERLQTALRRGYNDYKRVRLAESADVAPTATPAALVAKVVAQMDAMEGSAAGIARASEAVEQIESVRARLQAQRTELDNQVMPDPKLIQIYDDAIAEVGRAAGDARTQLASVQSTVAAFQEERSSLELLLAQVDAMERQVRDTWQAVALGITAEALSHEVANVTDRLRGSSTQLVAYLRKNDVKNRPVWDFVEQVRAGVASLAKQISRLDPSLRNVREKRDTIAMSKELDGVRKYFEPRWKSVKLSLEIDVVEDFSVLVSVGRLNQVFDNLLLNSEYWLEHLILDGGLTKGIVNVRIEKPYVFVTDNGPGIDPSIEGSLFDPFVTTKPSTRGRGLGLFVVSQLLDADQIRIALDEERNARGRLTTFRLDFRRALADN